MPSTGYTILGENLQFGCSGAAVQINGTAQTVGFVQSCKKGNTMKTWEGKDSNGQVVSKVVYDSGGNISASLILKAGATLPVQGDTLTVGGVTGLIESVDVSWQNEQGTQIDISATWSAGVDTSQTTTGGGSGGSGS